VKQFACEKLPTAFVPRETPTGEIAWLWRKAAKKDNTVDTANVRTSSDRNKQQKRGIRETQRSAS